MTITKVWLVRTVETAAVVAVTAFVGSIVAGGTVITMSTVHSAAVAVAAALATFVQSTLANLLNPPDAEPATLVSTALRQRSEAKT